MSDPLPDSARMLRRSIGAAIVILAIIPLYRLLSDPRTGTAGQVTTQLVDALSSFAVTGTVLILGVAFIASRFLPAHRVERALAGAATILLRPSTAAFALSVATLAATLTIAFSLLVLGGKPNMIDGLVQALHARFLSEGLGAGPTGDTGAFWHIQNSVVTQRGWVSQYPPGHVSLLAISMWLGAPWLLGPLLVGVCVYFTTQAAHTALSNDMLVARLGSLLCACSAFLIFIGGSFLNHVPAAAFLSVVVYCVLRAARGGPRWAGVAGFMAGMALTIRPWTALAVAVAVALVVWLDPLFSTRVGRTTRQAGVGSLARARLKSPGRLVIAALAGASIPVSILLWYNAYFFGNPLTFGYDLALGPRTGLGFGVDPWGNTYGAAQALAYTSSDITLLGITLLETPISATLVAGLFLCLARRLTRGERMLAAWALAPVFANLFYWHHGIYMGPRMVYEAAPAWILLFVAGLVRAVRAAPRQLTHLPAYSPRTGLATAFAFMLTLSVGMLTPLRAASYVGGPLDVVRTSPPRPANPALVFVHDAWLTRVAMRLAARGMRLDSVETAVRQNSTCALHMLADVWEREGVVAARRLMAQLDFEPRPTDLPRQLRISAGNTMRVREGERLTPECLRQMHADRNGTLDIAGIVWQGDVPGGSVRGPLYVRDLGPRANARLIAAMPEREPWLLYTPTDTAAPVLRPYGKAVQTLWGAEAVASATSTEQLEGQ